MATRLIGLTILIFSLILATSCSQPTPSKFNVNKILHNKQPLSNGHQDLYQMITAEFASQRQQHEHAIRYYLRLAHKKRNPEFAKRALQIALANKRLKTAAKAAELWTQLAPKDNSAKIITATLLVRIGQEDAALPYLDQLSKTRGKFANAARFISGNIAALKQQYQAAIKWYNDIKSGPFYNEAQIRANVLQGTIAYQQEKYSRAIKHLYYAYELSDRAEIAALLGEILWITGQRQAASKIWQKALRKNPLNPILIKTIKHYQPQKLRMHNAN